MTRGFLPLLAAIVILGVGVLGWATDGFRVVTTEGARRLTIERSKPVVPNVELIDQRGTFFSLDAYRGRPVLVEFIYTTCPTICGVLSEDFRGVSRSLREQSGDAGPLLLSISFDPAHDDLAALRAYAERYNAMPPEWRIAVPTTKAGLQTLLRRFGVVVIPDRYGGFVHSADIYLLNRDGRLVRILDPATPPERLERAARAIS